MWICFNMRKVPCSSRAVLKLFRKMFFALGKEMSHQTDNAQAQNPCREALSSTTQCPYSAALSRAKNMPQSLLAVRNFDLGTEPFLKPAQGSTPKALPHNGSEHQSSTQRFLSCPHRRESIVRSRPKFICHRDRGHHDPAD